MKNISYFSSIFCVIAQNTGQDRTGISGVGAGAGLIMIIY